MSDVVEQRPPIVVTGASGFIGGACLRHLRRGGYRVRALVRHPDAAPRDWEMKGLRAYRCRLPDDIDEAAFGGSVSAVIHCAFETRFRDAERARATNLAGTERLVRLTREAGAAQFVFISSVQARADALSLYGQTKYAAEGFLDPRLDAAVRPGMVLGTGGLFQRLRETIRRSPVVPMFYGGRQSVQTVWIDDLCDAVERVVRLGRAGTVHIAEEIPVPIREFYRRIAKLDRVRPLFVPLPGAPVLAALRLLERAGVSLPISSENLLGLKQLRPVAVAADLRALGVTVRPFEDSFAMLAGIRPADAGRGLHA